MNFLPPFNLCCVTDAHLLEIFDRYSTDSACGILDGLPSFSDGWSTVCHAVRVPRSVFSGQEDPLVPDDSPLVIDLSFIPVDNVFLDLLRSAMLRATLRLVSQHTGQSAPHSFSESGGYLAAMQTDLKIGHRCRQVTKRRNPVSHKSLWRVRVSARSPFCIRLVCQKRDATWFHMLRSRYISYVP